MNDAAGTTQRLSAPMNLFRGVVVDVVQNRHCYVVSRYNDTDIIANAGTPLSLSPIGQHWEGQYPPGTPVLCARLSHDLAIILCAIPEDTAVGAQNPSDWMVQRSGAGVAYDNVHRVYLDRENAGGIRNFSNNRLLDAMPGDAGFMNALGVGVVAGVTSSMMRAGDMSGVWCFYRDQHTRIAGQRLEVWTAGSESDSFQDGYECSGIEQSTPYSWETLGLSSPGARGLTTVATKLSDGVTESPIRPIRDGQIGVYRLKKITGYLGDLERILVSCPSTGAPDFETKTTIDKAIGLSETVRQSSGVLSFRSATGIHFQKTSLIRVPTIVRKHDDPDGDFANYRSAGVGSLEGPAHDRTAFGGTNYSESGAARTVRFSDLHAYLFSHLGTSAMDRHEKDIVLWKESSPPSGLSNLDFLAGLPHGNQFEAPFPNFVNVVIDHRPGSSVRIYRSQASFGLTDDGCFYARDGWGSAITMRNGNIELTCPGDVITRPGRSAITLAPKDVVLRSGRSADISAALGDVRIKAERNLQVLGGNSGIGGVLIESKGRDIGMNFGAAGASAIGGGVQIVARNSSLSTVVGGVYLRTINGGRLTLDADNGEADIDMISRDRFDTLTGAVKVMYTDIVDPDATPRAVEFRDGATVLFGQTGRVVFGASSFSLSFPSASFRTSGTVTALNGLIQNTGSDRVSRTAGSGVAAALTEANAAFGTSLRDVVTSELKTLQSRWNVDGRPGGVNIIERSGFSFRTDADYAIRGFTMGEAPWQQQYRFYGAAMPWDEPTVEDAAGLVQTMPWPGLETWTSDVFVTADPTYYDRSTGSATDPVVGPQTLSQPVSVKISENYLVNVQR